MSCRPNHEKMLKNRKGRVVEVMDNARIPETKLRWMIKIFTALLKAECRRELAERRFSRFYDNGRGETVDKMNSYTKKRKVDLILEDASSVYVGQGLGILSMPTSSGQRGKISIKPPRKRVRRGAAETGCPTAGPSHTVNRVVPKYAKPLLSDEQIRQFITSTVIPHGRTITKAYHESMHTTRGTSTAEVTLDETAEQLHVDLPNLELELTPESTLLVWDQNLQQYQEVGGQAEYNQMCPSAQNGSVVQTISANELQSSWNQSPQSTPIIVPNVEELTETSEQIPNASTIGTEQLTSNYSLGNGSITLANDLQEPSANRAQKATNECSHKPSRNKSVNEAIQDNFKPVVDIAMLTEDLSPENFVMLDESKFDGPEILVTSGPFCFMASVPFF